MIAAWICYDSLSHKEHTQTDSCILQINMACKVASSWSPACHLPVMHLDLPAMSYRRPFNPTHSVPAAIHCLSRLLRERSVRVLFQRVSGSVHLLAPLLRSNAAQAAPNQQLLYEAGMCVWQLTFYEPAAEAMGSSGVVQGLVEMARQATKEKVSLPI